MKLFFSIVATITIATSASGFGAPISFDRDLTQIKTARDQALKAAAEPIDRRYRESLEQLLKRTTQGGDLETAVKVKQELETLQSATQPIQPPIGKWLFRVGTFTFERTLKDDGSMTGGAPGKWYIKDNKLLLEYYTGYIEKFQFPPRAGKLTGKDPKGNTIIGEKRE